MGFAGSIFTMLILYEAWYDSAESVYITLEVLIDEHQRARTFKSAEDEPPSANVELKYCDDRTSREKIATELVTTSHCQGSDRREDQEPIVLAEDEDAKAEIL